MTIAVAQMLALALCLTFAWAGVAKLLRPAAFRRDLATFGLLPTAAVLPASLAVPIFELAAVLVALLLDLRIGAGALAGFLLVATASAARSSRLGRDPHCGCLLPGSAGRFGWYWATRNATLLCVCLAVVSAGPSGASWSLALILGGLVLVAALLVAEELVHLLSPNSGAPTRA